MGSGGPQERNFDTGIAVLLNAFFHLFRCAAGSHSLDIGVWNRLDEPFHTALSVSFLEKRDVFFPDVRFANPHLRTGDKGNLHRIEFGGHFPPNGVQSLGVVIFDGAVDDLCDFELGEIPSGFFCRVLDNFKGVDGIFRRAHGIEYDFVASPMAASELTESRISSMVSEKKAISKPRSSACRMTSAISLALVNLP